MTTIQPFTWLKQLPTSLLQKDEIPLIGFPPAFPWNDVASSIQKVLGFSKFSLKPKSAPEWRKGDDLYSGFGKVPTPLYFSLGGGDGLAAWLMSQQDISFLMSLLLTQGQTNIPIDSIDPDYQQGFYTFLALEAIHAIRQTDFGKELSLQILDEITEIIEDSLCLDVEITVEEHKIWGRLIVSNILLHQWKERFAERSLDLPITSKIALTFHVEVGKTTMSLEQWSEVKPGDFLVLDSSTVTQQGLGNVVLTIEGIPLFHGKLEDGNINILDYSTVHEESNSMPENTEEPTDETPKDEEFAFLDNEEEEDEENEAQNAEGEAPAENEENLSAEESDEEHSEGDLEEEASEEEEFLTEDEKERQHWPPPPEKRAPEHVKVETPQEEEEEQPFSPGQIPLTIVVEIGRVQMAIQKVVELQPGNILDLNAHPENGVDLVINGKRVGKGELLQIGETLGVRILDIG